MAVERDADISDDALAQLGDEEEASGGGGGQHRDDPGAQYEVVTEDGRRVGLESLVHQQADRAGDGQAGGGGEQEEEQRQRGVAPVGADEGRKMHQRFQITPHWPASRLGFELGSEEDARARTVPGVRAGLSTHDPTLAFFRRPRV